MVQGLPGTTFCNGPLDVVRKVMKAEGFRGLYRGFGLTAVTQSPASALWWGVYGAAQHIIWRCNNILALSTLRINFTLMANILDYEVI